MEGWIPAGGHFIEADVIRWTEGVFGPRRGKSIRAMKLGERIVTAEVLLFLAGKAIFHTSGSSILHWLVVMVFGLPAALSGFSVVQQVWQFLLPSTTWQYVVGLVAAAATGTIAITRLAVKGTGSP